VAQATAQQPRTQEAGTIKVEPAPVLEFGVSGLTKENLEIVKIELTRLTSPVYVCSGCDRESPKAGSCEACKVELKAEKKPLFQEVAPSAEQSTVRVRPAAGRTLRYSELDRALATQSIRIESARFPLPGQATLVLRGGTSQSVPELEKILGDANLFDAMESHFDPAPSEIRISVRSGKKPPTMAEVTSILKAAGTKATLADVIWGQPMLKG
jgi:hypothetical protein